MSRLGNFLLEKPKTAVTPEEDAVLANLSVDGNRLMGFFRTNLFKRLESSGHSFLLSVERHILRNFVFLHAIQNKLALPIGTQDADLRDTRTQTNPIPKTGMAVAATWACSEPFSRVRQSLAKP